MSDLITLISTNGIGVVCVAYLIYFQSTTMKEMLTTLGSINERLTIIENNMSKEKEV
ncbi:MAG: hypothetical protein IKL65_00585 [Bacilli bacterium]|nr:hypothetical protein [Bacilli bacterium]MBR6689813.1 hypothetical protein [Bacilli bacterium]